MGTDQGLLLWGEWWDTQELIDNTIPILKRLLKRHQVVVKCGIATEEGNGWDVGVDGAEGVEINLVLILQHVRQHMAKFKSLLFSNGTVNANGTGFVQEANGGLAQGNN